MAKKRIVKTRNADVWMNPPYLSAEYMDSDAALLRAWVARTLAERWYDEHPEFKNPEKRMPFPLEILSDKTFTLH